MRKSVDCDFGNSMTDSFAALGASNMGLMILIEPIDSLPVQSTCIHDKTLWVTNYMILENAL